MELIGIDRYQLMNVNWLPGDSCSVAEVELVGLSEGGNSLKIPIADNEFIWIKYRSDYGFDFSPSWKWDFSNETRSECWFC